MDKNTNGADVEQGGSQEQGRRIPPARRAKQQGGKGGGSAEGKPRSSKQIMTEKMVKAILRVTHGWNPQETPGSILISDEVQPIFTGIKNWL